MLQTLLLQLFYWLMSTCDCLSDVLQGTPEFVAVSQCVHYFEWRTYTACKNNKFKPQKEVRVMERVIDGLMSCLRRCDMYETMRRQHVEAVFPLLTELVSVWGVIGDVNLTQLK